MKNIFLEKQIEISESDKLKILCLEIECKTISDTIKNLNIALTEKQRLFKSEISHHIGENGILTGVNFHENIIKYHIGNRG